ncbi:hypothetical protein TWF281_004888 [Arthrobotrys megalospora]
MPPMSKKAQRKLAKAKKRDISPNESRDSPSKRLKSKEADGLVYNPELISFEIYIAWRELLASFLDIYDGMGLDSSSTGRCSSLPVMGLKKIPASRNTMKCRIWERE